MLFSEPKIPQSESTVSRPLTNLRFSALQRAENSSIYRRVAIHALNDKFQCSSASRKFLNEVCGVASYVIRAVSVLFSEPKIPQSAESAAKPTADRRFSALQRAENSSILTHDKVRYRGYFVSVLFSEPKIPQLSMRSSTLICSMVSVLFSEPKIPQSPSHGNPASTNGFVSVLFSEPKIPQWDGVGFAIATRPKFQCSSASRKFLNRSGNAVRLRYIPFQCSSASRKFLN